MEHCQCFSFEDVFLIFSLGSENTVPLEQYFPIHSLGSRECENDISVDHPCCKCIYQEIHPYSAMNICSVSTTNVLTFWSPGIEPVCIIAGALSVFSVWGCVPDILPRECSENTVPRAVFPNTLPTREQGVYWKTLSLLIIPVHISRNTSLQCNAYWQC